VKRLERENAIWHVSIVIVSLKFYLPALRNFTFFNV